jgi:hypothetical protein
MAQGFYAYIQPVDQGAHPDQGLPGGGRPSRPGRPIDPGFGWGGGERPGHGLPRPPHVWPRPPGGGLPVDPDWGVSEGGEHPDHGLPIYPVDPEHPDNVLPEVPGEPPPEVDPPPGTIWPPLPPEIPAGKAIALVGITGVGFRYVVIDIPQHPEGPEVEPPDSGHHPDQGLPGRPGVPPRPGQPPSRPPQPGQPLPRPPVQPPAGGVGGRPPVRPTPQR